MKRALSDHIINRLVAVASTIALVSGLALMIEQVYPGSMITDLFVGTLLALVFLLRRRLPLTARMLVLCVAGLLAGTVAVIQTPVYANGYLVLGAVMVMSFTHWEGWRAWIMPVAAVGCVVLVAGTILAGWADLQSESPATVNKLGVWVITAMTMGMLAVCTGNVVGDLKRRLHARVADLELANQKLYQSAFTDALTGLGNRKLLENAIGTACANGESGCLLLIELTEFGHFNTLHGHARGDEVLRQVADMLATQSPAAPLIASLPGVQFGVWLSQQDTTAALDFMQVFARRFDAALGASTRLQAKGGAACYGKYGPGFPALMRNAAVALTDARSRVGVTAGVFSPEMARKLEEDHALRLAVRQALDNRGFYPVYQTKVDAATGRICGAEGLARMAACGTCPAAGPSVFIPVIHEEGWMIEFGIQMLEAIVHDTAILVQRHGPDIKVSANVSPPLFLAPQFIPALRSAVASAGINPRNLVVEITEEVFATNLQAIVAVTSEVRAMGIEVSLDDFGAGFSSLSYLRAVQFDEIKIDRSFVHDIERDYRGKVLFSAIFNLGVTLGSRMVAEGVETASQLDAVRMAGCNIIQGYLYSRPEPLEVAPCAA